MELPKELSTDVQGAWLRFIERTEELRPGLYRYCRSLTGSVWDGEDLVQDTLLRGFAKLGEISQPITHPRAYLLRIASNLWIDKIRRPDPKQPETSASADDPSSRLEVRDAARELISQLSPQERAAVVLKDVFDFRLEETAEILGTTVGTIKTALHRGRDKLATPDAGPPPVRPSDAILDGFVEAFNARDIERLTALFREDATAEVIGMGTEFGSTTIRNSSLRYTLDVLHLAGQRPIPLEDGEPFAERHEFHGEPIIVLWYAPRDGEKTRVVRDAMRFEELEGSIARLRYYYFCPEALSEITSLLGLPLRTNGYRYA